MNAHRAKSNSLRLDRLEATRLLKVFALSAALHLFLWGGYAIGKKYHWWDHLRWPAWVQALNRKLTVAKTRATQPQQREAPPMFMYVNRESSEPPKDTQFYSDRSSKAASPEANKADAVPKLDGQQTQVLQTEDVPRKKFDQLMPDPPKPERQSPKVDPGDLTLAKPERPRTLKDALLRNQANLSPSQRAKLDGGMTTPGAPSFDVKATGFGAYDRALIDAVKSHWYELLESMSYESYRQGQVRVEFVLNYDGTISDLKVVENTVTDSLGLLCRMSIEKPAPFGRWSRDMRLSIGEDQRRITFTFYYN